MSKLISPFFNEYNDNNGIPNAGGKVLIYNAGTTTLAAVFTSLDGSAANTNPVILDNRGYPINPIWLTDGLLYDMSLLDASDTPLYHLYNVAPLNDVAVSGGGGGGGTTTSFDEWALLGANAEYLTSKTFRVAGNFTAALQVNRRLKIAYSGSFLYGTIKSAVYSANYTTVTMVMDGSSALAVGIGAVSYGVLNSVNSSVPPYLYPNYEDVVINGRFLIAANGASFAAPASGAYDLDGWLVAYSSAAVVTVSQQTGSSTGKKARVMTVTTADATIAASDYYASETRLEGYDCIQFINTNFTLGFNVKSSVTGVHCVSIANGTSNFVAEYTITAANTWEYKTITIPGGTPTLNAYDNAPGLLLYFINAAGTSIHITPNAWVAGGAAARASVNQVNDFSSIGFTFSIENVSLNTGNTAQPQTNTHAQELLRCQRYFFKDDYWVGGLPAATNISLPGQIRGPSGTVTGGGAGFTYTFATGVNFICGQTTAAKQTLVFASR